MQVIEIFINTYLNVVNIQKFYLYFISILNCSFSYFCHMSHKSTLIFFLLVKSDMYIEKM